MTYGYIRVSTEEQNVKNQQLAISERFKVDKWVEETKSGTLDYRKRSLGDLINTLTAGDILVVTELSRLGRSLTMIFNIVSILKDRHVRIVAIKNSFDMNPNNPNDIVSSVLLFAFGLSAQIERELISERTKQGLATARAKGRYPGRRKGQIPYYTKLRQYQSDIEAKYKSGSSVLSLAKEYGVRWNTMKNFVTFRIYQKAPPLLTECPRRHGHPSHRELEYFRLHDAT